MRGFTFVELLIAATMVSILFVGLGSHLRGGFAVWQRTTRSTEALQRQRVALEGVERDLANAFVYDPSGAIEAIPALATEANRLSWTTVEPATRQQPARARVVAYACGEHDGEPGLWRTSQSAGEVRAQAAPTAALLLSGCEALSARYAYLPADPANPLEWYDTWQGAADRLPRLLEISLEVSGRSLRRTMRIPVGVLESFEAAPSS